MPHCVMRWCYNYASKSNKADGITYHQFPSKKHNETRQKWIEIVRKQRSEDDWTPSNFSRVCSIHFDIDSKYMTLKGRVKIKNTAIPTLKVGNTRGLGVQTSSTETPQAPWQDQDSSGHEATTDDFGFSVPLLSRLEQCRFCGDFSKQCLYITDNTPYVNKNKTDFNLNGVSVSLDFNEDSLPKTVCHDCDVKLQEIADFVNVVKAAQESLINVADEENQDGGQNTAEKRVVSEANGVVKIEYESPSNDDDNVNDVLNDATDGDRVNDDNEARSRNANKMKPSLSNKRKIKEGNSTKLKKVKATKLKQSNIEDKTFDSEASHEDDEKLDVLVKEKKLKVIKNEKNESDNEVNVKEEPVENTDSILIQAAVESILLDTANFEPGVS